MSRTWTQVWGLMDYFSGPLSLCRSIFISIFIMEFINESFIMTFIECMDSMIDMVYMITQTADAAANTAATAALICPLCSFSSRERRKEEGESERERELLLIHKRDEKTRRREKKRERCSRGAAGSKCARMAAVNTTDSTPQNCARGSRSGCGPAAPGEAAVSRCSPAARSTRRRARRLGPPLRSAVRPQPGCRAPPGWITGEAAQALLDALRVRGAAEAGARMPARSLAELRQMMVSWAARTQPPLARSAPKVRYN